MEFTPDAADAVVLRMNEIGARHAGWINFQPGVRDEDMPPGPTAIGMFFATSLHEVPVCTWVPGKPGRKGEVPDTIGIEHATGPKALARLAAENVALPELWRWEQDSPRRGLVVRPPLGTPHEDVLSWLLRAGTLLTTVPLTGEWLATIYNDPSGPDPSL
jgi:hypothetical protein